MVVPALAECHERWCRSAPADPLPSRETRLVYQGGPGTTHVG
ncbi:hypothetical protein KEM60_00269 [Austwickia sp. TVS 96-490-7B]|nr:hypothetical protein [Austwickia sp. TVS 96-490-7B]